ncbi:MAG: DUF4255 domain-containing protein [Anaerolineaceae bacterium]
MIYEINEALRDLLKRELPIRKGDVDIVFDLPKRDWSARLNKPTLNIFLYDMLENIELRGSEQWRKQTNEDGTFTLYRNPVRVNFYYLITSWAKEVQDEQTLLSSTLITLLRQPNLPDDVLPEVLKNQPVPIRLEVVQNKGLANISDFWNTMDNDPHPGIRLTVTLSIDPYKPEIVSPVNVSELRFRQNENPELPKADQAEPGSSPSKSYYTVKGSIASAKYSPSTLKVAVAETGQIITVQEDGKFGINRLNEGDYHIDILYNDRVLRHEKIHVPSAKYEIVV